MGSVEERKFYANAWLKDLEKKIDRVPFLYESGEKLDGVSWKDEAFILCIVYLDRLSNRIKSSKETCHQKFCELLINYGDNNFFGKVAFRQLLRNLKGTQRRSKMSQKKKSLTFIGDKILNYLKSQSCDLDEEMFCKKETPEIYQKIFEQKELISFLNSYSILTEEECIQLGPELWRGTIASICYEFVRCPTIHEDTQRTLRVENSQLNFNILHPALKSIFKHIEKMYQEEGKFLGFDDDEHLFSYT